MTTNFLITLFNILISLMDVLFVLLPALMSVAFMTIIERKQLAAHQRRVGPNVTGYYGILQPFEKSGIYFFMNKKKAALLWKDKIV